MKIILIKTTYPNLDAAKNLARILLEKKLAACIQIQPINSLYSWKNQIEEAQEFLVEIKTREEFFNKINTVIKENHSYEIPEIIKINIAKIDENYQSWILANT